MYQQGAATRLFILHLTSITEHHLTFPISVKVHLCTTFPCHLIVFTPPDLNLTLNPFHTAPHSFIQFYLTSGLVYLIFCFVFLQR